MASAPAARVKRRTGASGASRWEVAIRPPSERLRPYVRGDYVGYTERSPGAVRRPEFPVPFAVMVFEFGPPLRILEAGDARRVTSHRGGFVGGLCDEHVVCEHDGFQQGLQVHLTPIGARLLFDVPMSELSAQIAPVHDLLPAGRRDLGVRLQEAATWDERFDVLDAALAASVHEAGPRTRAVSWAVDRIERSGGALSIRDLAREMGYSRKHLVAMFRDQVGIPPKLLARIVRFHRLVQHLRGGGGEPWADLAQDFGYYDQSHLVRDVRHFTGVVPGEARGIGTSLAEIVAPAR